MHHFHGNAQGIADGYGGGTAVRDDGDALHSQQGAAAYGIRREARLHGPERTGRTGRSHHPEGIRLEFHFKPFAKCLGRGFTGFQQNIAGKSVRQHYVYFVLKEIVAFHIAHKFKGEHAALLQMLQQCKSAFGEIRSFFVLGPVAHDTHFRHGLAINGACQNAGHNGISHQMPGLGIRVGAGVRHIADSEFIGKLRHDSGAFHSVEQAELNGGGRYGRSRVAGTDNSVRIP